MAGRNIELYYDQENEQIIPIWEEDQSILGAEPFDVDDDPYLREFLKDCVKHGKQGLHIRLEMPAKPEPKPEPEPEPQEPIDEEPEGLSLTAQADASLEAMDASDN